MSQSDVIPAPAGGAVRKTVSRSIGNILVDAGRLKIEDVGRILRLQREKGLPFGDAAIQLELITQADIDFALSRQFGYSYLLRGQSKISQEVVAAYLPFSGQAESLRVLRSQLMLRWFDTDPGHKALAVVSAERGEGRSFIVANLAVVFSQLGERTLIIDADLRNPSQHRLFGLDNRAGLSAVLSGRAGREAICHEESLLNLSILPAGPLPPNPTELLGRSLFRDLLRDLAGEYDVILIDTPATGGSPDSMLISTFAGSALIIVRKNAARVWNVRGIVDGAMQTSTTLVGSLLNDF